MTRVFSNTAHLLTVSGKSKVELENTSIVTETARLYLWHQGEGHFLKQADVVGSVGPHSSREIYYITATTDEGQQLLSHRIGSELNARWSARLFSITWNHTSRQGHLSSWCMKFEGAENFKVFREAYEMCLYQTLHEVSRGKATVSLLRCLNELEAELSVFKAGEQAQASLVSSSGSESAEGEGTASDVEFSPGGLILSVYLVVVDFDTSIVESDSEPDSDEIDESVAFLPNIGKSSWNSQLAVGQGQKNNRTFVLQGDKIGVFSHSEEGKITYAATIKDLGYKKNKGLKPTRVIVSFFV